MSSVSEIAGSCLLFADSSSRTHMSLVWAEISSCRTFYIETKVLQNFSKHTVVLHVPEKFVSRKTKWFIYLMVSTYFLYLHKSRRYPFTYLCFPPYSWPRLKRLLFHHSCSLKSFQIYTHPSRICRNVLPLWHFP